MKSDAEAAEAFSRYLKFWTEERARLTPRDVEERASEKGARVSDTKIAQALNGLYADHRMRTLEAIAIAIGRPIEEVFMAALGHSPPLVEDPEFTESEAAHLRRLVSELSSPADRKYYNRHIRMLVEDVQRRSSKDG